MIPKPLRDFLGLTPGEVELTADGMRLRVEPVAATSVGQHRGRLVIRLRELRSLPTSTPAGCSASRLRSCPALGRSEVLSGMSVCRCRFANIVRR